MQRTMDGIISRETIAATKQVIRPHIRRTRLSRWTAGDFGLGSIGVILKLELLQHAGLVQSARRICQSAHAGGSASGSRRRLGRQSRCGGRLRRQEARPGCENLRTTHRVSAKVARIRAYGADVVVGGDDYADALAASELWTARVGAMAVHAFDQTETLLGQGTIGIELEEEAPGIETLLIPVGGGGLIGGIAAWYSGKIKVIGVEPEASPTLSEGA